MCYKRGVAESIPHLPHDAVFEHSEYFREFLLTKRTHRLLLLVNAALMSAHRIFVFIVGCLIGWGVAGGQ